MASPVTSPYPSQYVATLLLLSRSNLSHWALSTRSLSKGMMSSLLSNICWSKQASGLVGQGASQEGWNRPATWEMGQWLYGPSMQGWCEACHQTSAAPSRLLGWSAKVCPERNLLNLFHHLVVHSSTAFTSDLPILFSTHSSTSWENQIGVLVCKTGTSTCWSKIALVFWTAVTLALQNRPASWVIGKCLHGPSMPGWCQACYQTSC